MTQSWKFWVSVFFFQILVSTGILCNMWHVCWIMYDLGCMLMVNQDPSWYSMDYRVYMGSSMIVWPLVGCHYTCALINWSVPLHSGLYWTTVLVLSTPPHHTTMQLWGKPHHHRTVPLQGGRSHHQQDRSNLWCGGITKSWPPSRLVNRHRVHPHQGRIILQGDSGNAIQIDG